MTIGVGRRFLGLRVGSGVIRRALSTLAGVGLPSTLPSESRMNAGLLAGHHAHLLGLHRDPLRVAERVELHGQRLLLGVERLRLRPPSTSP